MKLKINRMSDDIDEKLKLMTKDEKKALWIELGLTVKTWNEVVECQSGLY